MLREMNKYGLVYVNCGRVYKFICGGGNNVEYIRYQNQI